MRVNSLCPGMVKTPLNRSVWEAWNQRQPVAQRQSYEEWTADKIKKLVRSIAGKSLRISPP